MLDLPISDRARPSGPPPMLRCVGIDPGGTSGLACVDVPYGARRPDLARLVWIGHAVVRASASKLLSPAEQRAALGARVAYQLDNVWRPNVVVLEEPADARVGWENSTRRVSRTGGAGGATLFGLGAHFGLALAAATQWGHERRVYSYPVNNYRGRPGWMQAGAARPQSREATMARLRLVARAAGCTESLTEDVLMALGVVYYHLAHHQLAESA